MKEAVAIAKEADMKKGFSPTRSDNSVQYVRDEPERQLGSLRDVIGNIRRDGGTPSVESIATELSGMHSIQRAPVLSALQQTHGNRYVQRVLDLARNGTGEVEAAPELEQSIQRARGGGQELDRKVRGQMESAFGTDFSGVRIPADTLNRELNARAFTTGQDAFVRQGSYNPGSSSGRELLTHVVPRNGNQVQRKLAIGQPTDQYERGADKIANNLMRHERKVVQEEAESGLMQRQESDGGEMIQLKEENKLFEREAISSSGLKPLGTQIIPPPNNDTVNDAIRQGQKNSGSGVLLQDDERAFFEHSIGHDFGAVRVHTDHGADALTNDLGARAATIGNDIYIASDHCKPGNIDYRSLLAHELTHVAQTGGQKGNGQIIGDANSANEQQASKVENAVSLGTMFSIRPRSSAPFVQLTPRPLPQDTVAMTFPSPLDPAPVNRFCEGAAGSLVGVFSNDRLWANLSMGSTITQVFQSGYFSQRNTSWSGEETIDPGVIYPYYTVRVTIRLLEDDVEEVDAGSRATVGSTSGARSIGRGSLSTSTTASGGMTVGGGVERGPVSGSAEATAGAGLGTSIGRGTEMQMGGAATGSQTSATTIYTSNVYAEVTVAVKQWDRIAIWHRWGDTSTIRVGTARYSRPTLRRAPTASGASPTPPT